MKPRLQETVVISFRAKVFVQQFSCNSFRAGLAREEIRAPWRASLRWIRRGETKRKKNRDV